MSHAVSDKIAALNKSRQAGPRAVARTSAELGRLTLEECEAVHGGDEVDQAIAALNSMLEADPVAISELVGQRVACNETLADHPTCQVGGGDEGPWQVGLLGVLNGIFGRVNGPGHIAAVVEENGRVVRFERN